MATYREHPAAAHSLVTGGDTQLVDVREPAEVALGTLDGAVNIPLGELPGRLGELDADRRVVLLCRSGARSAAAAELLVSRSFVDVVNLSGGMLAAAQPR
jgi:rhodanese-related sulfurtransferase